MSWSKSDSIAKLTEALVKVQAELKPVKRAGRADVVSKRTGAKFSYDYQTLQDVWEALRPLLAKEGLAIFQPATADGSKVGVTTILSHVSDEWLASTLWMEAADASPQSIGSCVSYARRYGLCSTIGVVADDDDDGQAAQPGIRPQGVTRGASKDSTPSVPPTSPAPASGPPSGREAAPTNGAIGHMHRRDGESLNVASVLAHARSLGWKDAEVSTRAKKLFRKGLTSLTAVELLELDDIIETGEDVQEATNGA